MTRSTGSKKSQGSISSPTGSLKEDDEERHNANHKNMVMPDSRQRIT